MHSDPSTMNCHSPPLTPSRLRGEAPFIAKRGSAFILNREAASICEPRSGARLQSTAQVVGSKLMTKPRRAKKDCLIPSGRRMQFRSFSNRQHFFRRPPIALIFRHLAPKSVSCVPSRHRHSAQVVYLNNNRVPTNFRSEPGRTFTRIHILVTNPRRTAPSSKD